MNRIAPLVAIAAVLAFAAAAEAQCCYTTYYQPATVYYSAAPRRPLITPLHPPRPTTPLPDDDVLRGRADDDLLRGGTHDDVLRRRPSDRVLRSARGLLRTGVLSGADARIYRGVRW